MEGFKKGKEEALKKIELMEKSKKPFVGISKTTK